MASVPIQHGTDGQLAHTIHLPPSDRLPPCEPNETATLGGLRPQTGESKIKGEFWEYAVLADFEVVRCRLVQTAVRDEANCWRVYSRPTVGLGKGWRTKSP